jgi:hypothetical protein
MKQVKGSILLPWVKAIKANKSGIYDNLLTRETKEAISKLILSSSWYPFDIYKNCFNTIAQVEGKGDRNLCREWGRAYSESIMKSVYKSSIVKTDPQAIMDRFKLVMKSMFNFGQLKYELSSNNRMIITVEDFDPDFELFYYIIIGWLEKYIELCLGKPVQAEFIEKSWEGSPVTRIKVAFPD